jgi:IPT/TIG domain
MTKSTHRRVWLLAFAIASGACDERSPSEPTPLLPTAPSVTPISLDAPSVTAISPSTGSTARPTPVMIRGTGFIGRTTVTVNAVALNVIVVNSTTITAIVPAHAAGPADVVVTNPSGLSGTLTGAFTYSFEQPYTVTASTDVVDAGGRMSVSWTATVPQPGDWLAVFRVGRSYEDEWYGLINGETSGTLTLTAPTQPGQYEFRYLVDLDYRDIARSSPVTVR